MVISIEEARMYLKKYEEFLEKQLKAVRKRLASDSGTDPIAGNQASASFQPSAARDQRISSDAKQYTSSSVSGSYLIRASSSEEENAGDVEEGESVDKILSGGSIQVVLKTDKKDGIAWVYCEHRNRTLDKDLREWKKGTTNWGVKLHNYFNTRE
ncbi:hypothetical protein EAF04_005532 [Stromatinia cepivora]|nr:hypothetical protein EAF04_005532 [Stromatinia cepivora]